MKYLVGELYNHFDVEVEVENKYKNLVRSVSPEQIDKIGYTTRKTKWTTFIILNPVSYLEFIQKGTGNAHL